MSRVLQGKVALVTGGSRGIGAAIAERLAADGADVVITYNKSHDAAARVVASIKAAGGRGEAWPSDAAAASAASALVPNVVRNFGRLDILVNNAGMFFHKPLEAASDEEFERIIDLNVRSVFLTGRAAAGVMQSGGRIINIGAISVDRVPFPGMGLYVMSKYAVTGLTKAWARELGPRQITVNSVNPGPIDTEMLPSDPPFIEMVKRMTAVERIGQPSEIADIVALLAAPTAGFITGATIAVDGGLSI
jgi:3-oxoacyl-[acyl-carrier protein] reductase